MSENPPNCRYEFFTVHTDSLSSNTWTNSGRQDSFVSHMFRPIENVVQVSVVTANIPVEDSNVCYLRVGELTSQFNESGGEAVTNSITSSVAAKDRIRGSLAKFNVSGSGRTIYQQHDYSTQTQFITPIRKIDRLTTELLDENGSNSYVTSNVFITYRFTCMKENLCPAPKSKKKINR